MDGLTREVTYLTGGVTALRMMLEIKRRKAMTPKLMGLPKLLDMLRHSIEADADKLYDRVSNVSTRKDAAFKKSHAILDSTEQGIGDVEKFVDDLERSNGGPILDDSSESSVQGPRSSELMNTGRKVA